MFIRRSSVPDSMAGKNSAGNGAEKRKENDEETVDLDPVPVPADGNCRICGGRSGR